MSKTLSLILVLLAVVIGCLVVWFSLPDVQDKQTTESIVTQKVETSSKNPTFTSWEEVKQYQTRESEEMNKYLAFLAIEESILKDVSYVCINRGKGSTTLREIVDEYAQNSDVYDNLPANSTTNPPAEEDSNSTSTNPSSPTQAPPPGTISYSQRDTVVPVKAKIKVREEVVYE